MTSRTVDVYSYDPLYKPLCNVPIVSGDTTAMNNITRNSFIVLVNEALYYERKLHHSRINSNQLRCYRTIVWYNLFDKNSYLCLETCEVNTIDFIPDDTKIGFNSHVPMEEELRTLPHIKVISG